jgi:THO complex subunit 7
MAAIRAEHETQNRTLQGHKSALDGIIAELSSLRFMGKELVTTESLPATPAPEGLDAIVTDGFVEEVEISNSAAVEESREGDEKQSLESVSDPAVGEGIVEDDIEMGEVEEDPREKGRKKLREELEEGEASDASSELSEPPDD